jgi:transcriptional regulator with XRE-family HTH domain
MSTPNLHTDGNLMTSFLIFSAVVTPQEKLFFKALGARIAALRREQSLTQQQLADELELTQQVIASYEIGRRRVPVSTLPPMARTLGVSIEMLLGESDMSPSKRGPVPKLARHMERIAQLPRAKQQIVIQMLDGVLAQASR